MALFNVEGDKFTQFQQSLSWDLAVTERFGLFASWEMLADHGSFQDMRQHVANSGFSYLLNEHLVVSWQAGVGLNEAAPDFITNVRFAYRF